MDRARFILTLKLELKVRGLKLILRPRGVRLKLGIWGLGTRTRLGLELVLSTSLDFYTERGHLPTRERERESLFSKYAKQNIILN